MAKQKIEMQELPAGVFTFEEIGLVINHHKYDSLLAITSVESYNNHLNAFPLTVLAKNIEPKFPVSTFVY